MQQKTAFTEVKAVFGLFYPKITIPAMAIAIAA